MLARRGSQVASAGSVLDIGVRVACADDDRATCPCATRRNARALAAVAVVSSFLPQMGEDHAPTWPAVNSLPVKGCYQSHRSLSPRRRTASSHRGRIAGELTGRYRLGQHAESSVRPTAIEGFINFEHTGISGRKWCANVVTLECR